MSGNDDFLYALKDDLPQDFADDLWQQLHVLEKEKPVKPARSWWVLAVASFATLFFGAIMIFVSAPRFEFLVTILNLPSRPVELVPITTDNIAQAEMIASEGKGHAYRMTLSPDDSTLAIGTSTGIYLHDAHDLNAEAQFIGTPSNYIQYMEYSDNGDLYIFTSYLNGAGLHRWDAEQNQFMAIYDFANSTSDDYQILQSIDLSPDGSQLMLVSCIESNSYFVEGSFLPQCAQLPTARIEIIDLNNLDNSFEIVPDNTANIIPAMTPDWLQLAYFDSGIIYIYDMVTGETHPVIETDPDLSQSRPFSGNAASLHFTPDASRLGFLRMSSGKYDSWSVVELNQVDINNPFIIPMDGSSVPDTVASLLIFHPITHDRLVSRSDSIMIYSAEDESRMRELRRVGQPRDMTMNSDGSRLYVLSSSGAVQALDWETQERININLDYAISDNTDITFGVKSQLFVNNSRQTDSISFLWDTSNNIIERHPLAEDSHLTNPITNSAFSKDERYIAYTMNSYIYVYDRIEDDSQRLYPLMYVLSMGFRDDGHLIVISAENANGGHIHIYDFTPEMLADGDAEYPMAYLTIDDFTIGCCFYHQPAPAHTYSLIPGATILAVFSCDGKVESFLASSSCTKRSINLISTMTGEILVQVDIESTIYRSFPALVHSADGQYLALGYCDTAIPDTFQCEENGGVVDIWRIDDLLNDRIASIHVTGLIFEQSQIELLAQENRSFLLAITNWEAIGENISDRFIHFWSVSPGGHAESVHQIRTDNIEFSPDSRQMIVAVDGQIQVWGVPK